MSTSTIEPIEYGLKFNTISKTYDDTEVYTGGWHVIGPFNNFLIFPATVTNIEFASFKGSKTLPLQARTSEGLTVTLQISFQYKLIKDDVGQLYKSFSNKYEENFVRIARGAIVEESAKFKSSQYWEERKLIGSRFQQAIDSRLMNAHARCTGFQLLSIDLPDTREQALINSQLARQIQKQKTYEQTATEIRSVIGVDNSAANKNITIINGEASAAGTRIYNEAEAFSQNVTITYQSLAFTDAAKTTGMTAADTLMDYIYYTNLLNLQNATMIVGANKVMLGIQSS